MHIENPATRVLCPQAKKDEFLDKKIDISLMDYIIAPFDGQWTKVASGDVARLSVAPQPKKKLSRISRCKYKTPTEFQALVKRQPTIKHIEFELGGGQVYPSLLPSLNSSEQRKLETIFGDPFIFGNEHQLSSQ